MTKKHRLPATLICAFAILCLGAAPATAVTGQLDPAFGNGGVASPAVGTGSAQVPFDSVRLADGSVVVAGYSQPGPQGFIARFTADGSPDPGFGDAGAVESDLVEGWDAVAVQPDGRIVVAGHKGPGGVIARFDADGTPDATYGSAGTFPIDPAGLSGGANSSRLTVRASALRVLDDGRIRLAGRFLHCGSYGCENQLMAGTTGAGAPDPEVGANGFRKLKLTCLDAVFTIDGAGGAIALGEDWYEVDGARTFARFGSDGSLEDERTTTTSSGYFDGTAARMITDTQGRILAAMGRYLVRLNPDGTPDLTFGDRGFWRDRDGNLGGYSGLRRWAPNLKVSDVGVDEQGRILLAGDIGNSRRSSAVVIRLLPDGQLDPTFGAGGMTIAWRGSPGGPAEQSARTRLLDTQAGKVMIAGTGPHDGGFGVNLAVLENGDAAWLECAGEKADFIGTEGDDMLREVRDAILVTLGGDDRISDGASLTVCSGPGDDVINVGTYGPNQVYAGSGDDRVAGSRQKDLIRGGSGRDLIRGGRSDDLLQGGPGADRLYGGSRDDHLYGGSGPDRLYGGHGFDRLFGGPGHDLLRGGPTGNRFSDHYFRSQQLRLRLVSKRRKVIFTGTVRERCNDGSFSTWRIRSPIPIRNGRFRDRSRFGDDWISLDEIEGRIRVRAITGRLRFIDAEGNRVCSTGKRPVIWPTSQAWVRFHARPRPRQRQIVRQ